MQSTSTYYQQTPVSVWSSGETSERFNSGPLFERIETLTQHNSALTAENTQLKQAALSGRITLNMGLVADKQQLKTENEDLRQALGRLSLQSVSLEQYTALQQQNEQQKDSLRQLAATVNAQSTALTQQKSDLEQQQRKIENLQKKTGTLTNQCKALLEANRELDTNKRSLFETNQTLGKGCDTLKLQHDALREKSVSRESGFLQLTAKVSEQSKALKELESRLQLLQLDNENLQTENARVTALAAAPLQLQRENQALLMENARLKQRLTAPRRMPPTTPQGSSPRSPHS